MDCREIGCNDVDWIHLAQDRDQGSCEHGNEVLASIKVGKFLD